MGDRAGIPQLSVVIPTRNRVALLADTIATIRAQDGVDLEIIAVDDASDDTTASMLDALALVEPRLRVMRQRVPAGAAAARNLGLAIARAPIVTFSDDDMRWVPTRAARLVAAFAAEPRVALVYHAIRRELRDGSAVVRHYGHLWRAGTPAVAVERSVLQAVGGFDVTLPRLQDLDCWIRVQAHLAATGEQTRYLDEALVSEIETPTGISTDAAAFDRAAAALLEKYAGIGPVPCRLQAAVHRELAYTYAVWRRWDAARRHARRALRLAPRTPTGWLIAAFAVAGPLAAQPCAAPLWRAAGQLVGTLRREGGR